MSDSINLGRLAEDWNVVGENGRGQNCDTTPQDNGPIIGVCEHFARILRVNAQSVGLARHSLVYNPSLYTLELETIVLKSRYKTVDQTIENSATKVKAETREP